MLKTWIKGELGMHQAPELVEGVGNGYRPDEQFVLLLDYQVILAQQLNAQYKHHLEQLRSKQIEIDKLKAEIRRMRPGYESDSWSRSPGQGAL